MALRIIITVAAIAVAGAFASQAGAASNTNIYRYYSTTFAGVAMGVGGSPVLVPGFFAALKRGAPGGHNLAARPVWPMRCAWSWTTGANSVVVALYARSAIMGRVGCAPMARNLTTSGGWTRLSV